jgi:hypothetical protein
MIEEISGIATVLATEGARAVGDYSQAPSYSAIKVGQTVPFAFSPDSSKISVDFGNGPVPIPMTAFENLKVVGLDGKTILVAQDSVSGRTDPVTDGDISVGGMTFKYKAGPQGSVSETGAITLTLVMEVTPANGNPATVTVELNGVVTSMQNFIRDLTSPQSGAQGADKRDGIALSGKASLPQGLGALSGRNAFFDLLAQKSN